MPILVYLSKNDPVRFKNKIKELDRRTSFWKNELPRRLAVAFYHLVARNILSQKGMGSYVQLNDRYAKQKGEKYGHSRYWIKTGSLVKYLQRALPTKISDTLSTAEYIVSLPEDMEWYTGMAEFGSAANNQPPRPIFGPTLAEFASIAKKETGYALRDIAGRWKS